MALITLCVGSKNPVKINAVRAAFEQIFPQDDIHCTGVAAPSGVADQLLSEQETREGAEQRVRYCQQQQNADYWVAMEGGAAEFNFGPATFAYVAIANKDRLSIGRSALLPLPPQVFAALQGGEELGDVMDRLFARHNVKQQEGAIGLLTGGLATRESIYTQALILAMAPFLNPALYLV